MALVFHPVRPHGVAARSPQARLDEAVGLAQALDLTVMGGSVAPLRAATPATLFGKGKVEELRIMIEAEKADVVVRKAAVTNAQQAFDRAKELLKTAAGTQKTYDDAEAALRQAKANLAWSETRLERRNAHSPADGTIEHILEQHKFPATAQP